MVTAQRFTEIYPGARAGAFDGTCSAYTGMLFGSLWRMHTEALLLLNDPVMRGLARIGDIDTMLARETDQCM